MTAGEFSYVEPTVGGIHDSMAAGAVTSEDLVTRYTDRIEAYDRDGPKLNGVVTVNPTARERARELDQKYEVEGLVGPLHGIPVLVKDQVSTADMATTYGSEAFADYVPPADATIVERLREAGAVVLAKTNLPDFAAGFVGYSSVLGQTKNPYALAYDPGGSSAGTGTGVAANLGVVGIGEDTGGSIRVPASCCNLFGLRPTTGLVSRTGLSPLVERQDTAGPMARTVADLARVFEVLVGFDPTDQRTGATRFAETDYRTRLDGTTLEGVRIGVLRERFGEGPRAESVTERVESALSAMAAAGAEMVDPVSIPDLGALLDGSYLHTLQAKRDIDAFLADLPDPPVRSVADIHQQGAYHDDLDLFDVIVAEPDDPTTDPAYWERVATQESLREAIVYCLTDNDLDAVAFPDVQVPPTRYAARHSGALDRDDYPVNTTIASQSVCPAISMPAGFTEEGLPVGVELLAAPYDDGRLLELAAAYEDRVDPRRPPESAPPLE